MSRYRESRSEKPTARNASGESAAKTPGRQTAVDAALAGPVQRRATGKQGSAPDAASLVANATTGASQSPDATIRGKVESVTGADLSGVRVHTGPESHAAADAVSARAYTMGQDVHFAAGEYDPSSASGKHLLAHELAHAAEQHGSAPTIQHKLEVSSPGDASELQADRVADAVVSGGALAESFRPLAGGSQLQRAPADATATAPTAPVRDIKRPQDFPTYEEWLAAFAVLPSFTPANSHPVIGEEATADNPAPTMTGTRAGSGESLVSHVSKTWIDAHLPEELRRTAYELPSDCADMAIILRHVWLYYHGRTEKYGSWTIGLGAGSTAEARASTINNLIVNSVSSSTIDTIVGPAYGGLKSFAALSPMLHTGDILVWDHHDNPASPTTRTGGHTLTIESIVRDASGKATSLSCIQGNQPVGETQAQEWLADPAQDAATKGATEASLRALPGRRIERTDRLGAGQLQDVNNVWTWNDGSTTLRDAGPPSGVTRPKAGATGRTITDWIPLVLAASASSIRGVFEQALLEMRAGIEGGPAVGLEPVTAATADALGQAAGKRLASIASAKGMAAATVDGINTEMRAQIRAFGLHGAGNAAEVELQFRSLEVGFAVSAPALQNPAAAEPPPWSEIKSAEPPPTGFLDPL